jgi:hypothetical protein
MLRINLDSKIMEKSDKELIHKKLDGVFNTIKSRKFFILGCGVVSYKTPPENILFLKKILKEY